MVVPTIDHPYKAVRREQTLDISFDAFVRAFESLLGSMDVAALGEASPPDRYREKLASFVGPSELALFQKLDHGGPLTALAGRPTRATTYVFGNALIAVEMTKHVPFVGLYVPLRLYVCALGSTNIVVTYDVPSATIAQFDDPEANRVARSLDAKVEKLIADAVDLAKGGDS